MLTISSPNTDRSLLTLAEIKSAVGVTDSSQDAELTLLAAYISAVITRQCQVPTAGVIPPTLRLETVTDTIRLSREQSGPLYLSRKPVVTFTLVSEAGVTLTASDYEADGHALYRLSAGERINWASGEHIITYSAGYDVVPYDLKFAAIRFAQAEYSQGVTTSRDPMLKREVIPGVREVEYWVDPSMTTKESVMPAEVIGILDRGGYIYKWMWMR